MRTSVSDKAAPCRSDARQFRAECLEQAIQDRRPAHRGGLIHHSYRGSQYVSIKYAELLAKAGIEPLVDSADDSYDNALTQALPKLESPSRGKPPMSLWKHLKEGGAAYVTRTRGPIITNDVLYQLS